MALINDRLVFEGDSFDGVRVLRIGETEVEVDVLGQRRVLRFWRRRDGRPGPLAVRTGLGRLLKAAGRTPEASDTGCAR